MRLRSGVLCASAIAACLAVASTSAQAPAASSDRDKVVITAMAPIPDVGEGAPRFTSSDVAVIEETLQDTKEHSESDLRKCTVPGGPHVFCDPNGGRNGLIACEIEHADKASNLAYKAAEATQAAEEARRAVMRGEVDLKAVEDAELARQAAVAAMQKERDALINAQADLAEWQDQALMGHKTISLDLARAKRGKAGWGVGLAKPDAPPGLSVVGVSAHQLTDKKGDFVLLQGKIRNDSGGAQPVPGLSGALLDERNWVVGSTVVDPDGHKKIAAGAEFEFGFQIRPAPEAMKRAIVTFAPKDAPPPRIHMNGILCPTKAPAGIGG